MENAHNGINANPHNNQQFKSGQIEIVCGPMFSGKTEELIIRVKRALYARQTCCIFKPKLDNRYAEMQIVSHDKLKLNAIPVDSANEILERDLSKVEVIGIDEAQFFGEDLLSTVQTLASRGHRVICAGLDMDFRGEPFHPMPKLLAIAEYVTKKSAICMVCGNAASRSYRLDNDEAQVLLGASEAYEARCRKCYDEGLASRERPQMVLFAG